MQINRSARRFAFACTLDCTLQLPFFSCWEGVLTLVTPHETVVAVCVGYDPYFALTFPLCKLCHTSLPWHTA